MPWEMAEYNITVNAYAPGIVGTAMWDLIDAELGKQRGSKLGEVIQKGETIKKYSQELIALGRVSVPEDVAKLVSFLSSRDSDYVTGQTMVVGESTPMVLCLLPSNKTNRPIRRRHYHDLNIVQGVTEITRPHHD